MQVSSVYIFRHAFIPLTGFEATSFDHLIEQLQFGQHFGIHKQNNKQTLHKRSMSIKLVVLVMLLHHGSFSCISYDKQYINLLFTWCNEATHKLCTEPFVSANLCVFPGLESTFCLQLASEPRCSPPFTLYSANLFALTKRKSQCGLRLRAINDAVLNVKTDLESFLAGNGAIAQTQSDAQICLAPRFKLATGQNQCR